MTLNLIKRYNSLLELDGLNSYDKRQSLENIFRRDFINSTPVFKGKNVIPTPKEGQIAMDVLFTHLTTKTQNKDTLHREYDKNRSIRIHWINYHLRTNDVDIFSVRDKGGIRTYLYDEKESYVIILEPQKKGYFLITAYYIEGRDNNKIINKKKRKLPDIY